MSKPPSTNFRLSPLFVSSILFIRSHLILLLVLLWLLPFLQYLLLCPLERPLLVSSFIYFSGFFLLTKYFPLVAFIPPVIAPPVIPVVSPLSSPTLSFTELIQDELLENFNQSPSNPEEPEPEVNELDLDVPESSEGVDDPEVEELSPPPPHLSLCPVCSRKIKIPQYVESIS